MYGELADDWREEALKLGRVWFLYLETSGPPAGSWTRMKVLVVVRRGPPVKVSVVPTDGVALAYNLATFNGADTVEDGNASVRFSPCRPGSSPYPQAPRRFTQFNGGLVSASLPVCATFTATSQDGVPVIKQLPLLGDACP